MFVFLILLSRGILDKLARFTYHPPFPLIKDWFWVSYHLIITFLAIFILFKYWKRYKLGLIFSVLPDFDWVMIYLPKIFSFQIPFWQEPILHKFLVDFLDLWPPFRFLNTLPDWNLKIKGAMLELVLSIILMIFIRLLGREKFNSKGLINKKLPPAVFI